MNYRIGDKAHHFMKGNMIGEVVDIIFEKDNIPWTSGGSFESKIYIVLKYSDGTKEKVIKSDLIKVF